MTLQPEDSGAKQTRGFSSLLRGTIRVENPLGVETDSESVEQVSRRRREAGGRKSSQYLVAMAMLLV